MPEAVAYAGIAGLPPARAVLAAIAGCAAYAAVGRSQLAIVSPTSSSAAILAATLAALPPSADRGELATLIVLMVAVVFFAARLLRMGGLTGFISRPVLRGFALGLAFNIILKQLPALVNVVVPTRDIFDLLIGLAAARAQWSGASIGLGIAALLLLFGLRRIPLLPAALVVLALGIAVTFVVPLPGVRAVGPIDMAISWPTLPPLAWPVWSRAMQFAVPLVLILFAESWGTMRALALRHGDAINSNRELGALALANLASAAVHGMPVGAGFSASNAGETAGALTRATAVIAAVGLALLIALAGHVVARLPEPVVAAVVIGALVHSLDPAPLARLWRLDRDRFSGIAAAVAVLVFGVLNGMLLSILLSLVVLVRRLATPRVLRLGFLDSGDYVDSHRHPQAVLTPDIAIWRPTEPLFFANAERVFGFISAGSAAARTVIVSLEESTDLDSTALDALLEFETALDARGATLRLTRVHHLVRDLLARAGAERLVASSRYSVVDAVASL